MEAGEAMKAVSPKWKRPEEVMKFHILKQKKRALSARINGNDSVASMNFSYSSSSEDSTELPAAKRRNPFVRSVSEYNVKGSLADESGVETDISSDTTLFHLLSHSQGTKVPEETPKSFANILKHLNQNEYVPRDVRNKSNEKSPPKIKQKDGLVIPIDWSIKNRIRLMSPTAFSWSGNVRTCEQASSITGFVRCVDTSSIKEGKTIGSLDTSPNAQFHQCCLYWQHPNIPWLQLFPRNLKKANASMISTQLEIAPMLLTEWTTAFKSLFQLVRTRQCPFFYMIANHFTCLFQAAGVAGINETHAIITPTTRGFRKMLDDEGVHYSMPLKRKRKSNEFMSDSDNSILETEKNDGSGDDDDDDDVDDNWLESMGIDSKDVKKMTLSQKAIDRTREGKIDSSQESLLLIEGANMQAFFNVLLNYKGCVSSTGPFAGVPPTLLSPSAFSLATLKSCKVRDSMVHVNGTDFYSIQIEGPVLPHAFRQICILLEEYKTHYSASLTTFKQSLSFTHAFKAQENDEIKSSSSSVFFKENLSDCGLSHNLISVFCESDPQNYDVIDKVEPKKVVT
ncbi:UNVERIFIED_CONTAM: hypothetical protein PYX00_009292 [Menopon gallinae]|uniref:Protein downstream neighbor of son homolog n=1 Tax=Menopon gallinae TaxID=328185 RepID=A0AAW2HAZ4_9NEOP